MDTLKEQNTKLQVLYRRLTQTLRAVWFGQNEEEEELLVTVSRQQLLFYEGPGT